MIAFDLSIASRARDWWDDLANHLVFVLAVPVVVLGVSALLLLLACGFWIDRRRTALRDLTLTPV
jgi:hypothetical protein